MPTHSPASSLVGVLSLVLFVGWLVFTLMRSSWATKQNEFVEQPIQFSHAHHVGGVGLDCRYCHTSVEKSSFAGIPPTKTCMNCHSQILDERADPRAGARQLPERHAI